MYNYNSQVPASSARPEEQDDKTPTTFKKVLVGASIFSIIVVLCLICFNVNKPLKFQLKTPLMKRKEPAAVDLMIIIYSASFHNYRRRAIRNTWLNSTNLAKINLSIKHFFIIGNRDMTNERRRSLGHEAKFEDIVTVPVPDDVSQSPWKLMETFKWLYEQNLAGFRFKYLLKCDDATYVRLDKLAQALKELEEDFLSGESTAIGKRENQGKESYLTVNVQFNSRESGWETQLELYWGYFKGSSKPSSNEYDWILCDYFLPHAVADSYILSNKLVFYLARNKNILRYYSREDVSLGVWLAAVNNVLRVHDRRFNPEGCRGHYFTQHNLTILLMQDIFEQFNNEERMCRDQNMAHEEYTYNWTLAPSQCCLSTI